VCAHNMELEVKQASRLRWRDFAYMEISVLSMLVTSALISVLHSLSFFYVHGFHPQGVVLIHREVEGRLCLCLYDARVHD
jgi:hypothetical protein